MIDAPDKQFQPKTVVPTALTAARFAEFGDVIEVAGASDVRQINEGHTTRYHDLARLDLDRNQGCPLMSIFRSVPKPAPVEIRLMERHPLGSQAFIPLSGHPYLVVVGRQDPSDLEVFLASPAQGVNFHAGTWHHYSLALVAPSDFLVIDRGGPGDNLEEVELPQHQRVRIDLATAPLP